ncbi:MAG: ABC transporter ATP-binding protein [Candidatus Aminicenantaceae bacterium]
MTKQICLICHDIKKSYGRFQILKGCSFELREGEFVGLVGENGSGKSTLIRCILGFTQVNSGAIKLKGSVGYCPQDNILNRRYRVLEHFKLIEALYRKNNSIDSDFIEINIDRLKLRPFLKSSIGNLSSGTYQKVKFLTSIYHSPRLIILDEPYDGFDWRMYLAFWEIVKDLKSRGAAILMISHLIYDRENFDRIFELKEGHLEKTKG